VFSTSVPEPDRPDTPPSPTWYGPPALAVGAAFATSTANWLIELLPRLSVAVQFTVVIPCAKVPPEGGLQLTATLPSTASSPAGAVHETSAPACEVAATDMFPGVFEIVGGVVSLTITVKLADVEFPARSLAEQTT